MRSSFHVQRRSWLAFAVIALSFLSGCVTDPVHNKVVPSRSTSIKVQAFTAVASKPFILQCRPFLSGGAWTTLLTLSSGSTPTLTPAQGDLYVINGNVVVPNSCWYYWHSQYTTELRFLGGPYATGGTAQPFSVYDAAGVNCLVDQFFDGVSYIDMMANCRLKTTSGSDAQSIYVHASGS